MIRLIILVGIIAAVLSAVVHPVKAHEPVQAAPVVMTIDELLTKNLEAGYCRFEWSKKNV